MSNSPIDADIVGSLGTLPTPPFVAMEIIRLTRDPESSATDLADVLSNDPVLATRILQVANSPAYGLAREVTTVDRATALLGLKAVKMMALSFSLAADVGDDAGALSLKTYWYHSLLNAVTARRWAELSQPGLSEEAFLAGLLSNLGRLVLARSREADYRKVLEASGSAWPEPEAESAVFGFSSGEVTALLLEEWGLPEIISAASHSVLVGGSPSADVNGAAELAAVLTGARAISAALSPTASSEDAEAFAEAVATAGVGEDEHDAFVLELEQRLRDMADTLGVDLPPDVSHQRLLDEARNRLVEVSLETAMNLETAERRGEELQTIAYNDQLTKVPNRRAFDEHLARVASKAARAGTPIGVLLFDIDHFKSFNDTYGHQIGDDVLAAVAKTMAKVTRTSEMLARYGGEEFVIVIEECDSKSLEVAGERLRSAVEANVVQTAEHGPLRVTVSGGGAVGPGVAESDGVALTKFADDALYEAKAAGRNRIVVKNAFGTAR